MNNKVVYIGMCADVLHPGHINVILEAKKLGSVVVVGLLTDLAITSYKARPYFDYQKRYNVISMIRGVDKVIPQESLDYTKNLMLIKPDYVVHGDDWKSGVQQEIRKKVIEVLSAWGGKVIDIRYTEGVSSTEIKSKIIQKHKIPYFRLKTLKHILRTQSHLRILEAHNAISATIVENTHIQHQNGFIKEYDGIWLSSLTDSAARGKPDMELVDITSKFLTLKEMLNVTTKPIIVDMDTGGSVQNFVQCIQVLENLGVSAVCIEDKVGLKLNSLYGTSVKQYQDTIENFCTKIATAKNAQLTDEFIIIARIESLVLGKGIKDAMDRAIAYIDAGADMILIHSISDNTEELLDFCKLYSSQERVPLVLVPTKYNHVQEDELVRSGARVIIYANHLLRSSYLAMQEVAKSILLSNRSFEAEEMCIPTKELLNMFYKV